MVECVVGCHYECKGEERWRFGIEEVGDIQLPFYEWWNEEEGDNIYTDS